MVIKNVPTLRTADEGRQIQGYSLEQLGLDYMHCHILELLGVGLACAVVVLGHEGERQ